MADATAQRIWNTALGQLQIHITRPNYDTWLKDTEGLRVEPGIFVVGVPTEFVKEMLAHAHAQPRLSDHRAHPWPFH